MKRLSQTRQFARDVKRMAKRGKSIVKLENIVSMLAKGLSLDPRYRDHSLTGVWSKYRDCHIEPDWILIYFTDNEILHLERTGSHNDLFQM